MPLIELSSDGNLTSKVKKSGTYYCTGIALSKEARECSTKVAIGEVNVMSVVSKGCLWTDSLQSCFPVIFKFKNGDIGLLHGMSTDLTIIEGLLNRDDLTEIQMFEKGTVLNSQKVYGFIENVIEFYQKNAREQPPINIQSQEHIATYGVVVCYKSLSNQPIIMIGTSKNGGNELAHKLIECSNKEDYIQLYEFEDATEKYKEAIKEERNGKSHQFFGEAKEEETQTATKKKGPPKCIIL